MVVRPDLNAVEKFWSWLRRRLREIDLKDAQANRPVLSKMAYKARVRNVVKSKRAQTAAANIANSLRKTCQIVIKKKGEASGR